MESIIERRPISSSLKLSKPRSIEKDSLKPKKVIEKKPFAKAKAIEPKETNKSKIEPKKGTEYKEIPQDKRKEVAEIFANVLPRERSRKTEEEVDIMCLLNILFSRIIKPSNQ